MYKLWKCMSCWLNDCNEMQKKKSEVGYIVYAININISKTHAMIMSCNCSVRVLRPFLVQFRQTVVLSALFAGLRSLLTLKTLKTDTCYCHNLPHMPVYTVEERNQGSLTHFHWKCYGVQRFVYLCVSKTACRWDGKPQTSN